MARAAFSEKIENVYIFFMLPQALSRIYKQDCKPGYVEDDHLSRTAVASRLKRPT